MAGGNVIATSANPYCGDRAGGDIEPSGNSIWIATHIEDVSTAEVQRRASAARRQVISDTSAGSLPQSSNRQQQDRRELPRRELAR